MKHAGFSLQEMMLTLIFVGLLVISTLPTVITSQTGKLALVRTKNVASLLQTATESYKTDLGLATPATPADVIRLTDLTKYLSKVTTGTLVSGASTCGGTYPCYRFADGSVLLPLSIGAGQVRYLFDPDGTGNVPTVTLVLDYNRTRVASLAAITGNAADDPAYTQPWTRL